MSMKNNPETLFEYAKKRLTLSASEKDIHRERLLAFMKDRPAYATTPSPYFSAWFYTPVARALALFVVVVAAGGGTTFAAEGTLPGDVLYPVKTGVTEPLREALAITPEQKAAVENRIVGARLAELAQLAAQHRAIDSESLSALQESVGTHIDAAQAAVKSLSAKGADGAALQANSNLSATLDAGSDILNSVSGAEPAVASGINVVTSDVSNAQDETDQLATQLTTEVASSTDADEIAGAIANAKRDTLDGLAALQDVLANPPESIDESDQAVIADGIAKIESVVADADGAVADGDDNAALILYTDASQHVATLQALVAADESLETVDVIGNDATSTDDSSN